MLASLVACSPLPVDDPRWRTDLDAHFRQDAKRFFGPGMDWRWFKAQGIAESDLIAAATSHAGAIGIMQIMPTTWEDIARRVPVTNPRDARHSITAGIWYDRWLYMLWEDLRSRPRLAFMFASYNAGPGRVQRDREQCACARWRALAEHLPAETRAYVERIMLLMGSRP